MGNSKSRGCRSSRYLHRKLREKREERKRKRKLEDDSPSPPPSPPRRKRQGGPNAVMISIRRVPDWPCGNLVSSRGMCCAQQASCGVSSESWKSGDKKKANRKKVEGSSDDEVCPGQRDPCQFKMAIGQSTPCNISKYLLPPCPQQSSDDEKSEVCPKPRVKFMPCNHQPSPFDCGIPPYLLPHPPFPCPPMPLAPMPCPPMPCPPMPCPPMPCPPMPPPPMPCTPLPCPPMPFAPPPCPVPNAKQCVCTTANQQTCDPSCTACPPEKKPNVPNTCTSCA